MPPEELLPLDHVEAIVISWRTKSGIDAAQVCLKRLLLQIQQQVASVCLPYLEQLAVQETGAVTAVHAGGGSAAELSAICRASHTAVSCCAMLRQHRNASVKTLSIYGRDEILVLCRYISKRWFNLFDAMRDIDTESRTDYVKQSEWGAEVLSLFLGILYDMTATATVLGEPLQFNEFECVRLDSIADTLFHHTEEGTLNVALLGTLLVMQQDEAWQASSQMDDTDDDDVDGQDGVITTLYDGQGSRLASPQVLLLRFCQAKKLDALDPILLSQFVYNVTATAPLVGKLQSKYKALRCTMNDVSIWNDRNKPLRRSITFLNKMMTKDVENWEVGTLNHRLNIPDSIRQQIL